MNTVNEIFRSLGRIEGKLGRVEGELIEIHKVSERVSRLEQMQSWLKGGWGRPGSSLHIPLQRNLRKMSERRRTRAHGVRSRRIKEAYGRTDHATSILDRCGDLLNLFRCGLEPI